MNQNTLLTLQRFSTETMLPEDRASSDEMAAIVMLRCQLMKSKLIQMGMEMGQVKTFTVSERDEEKEKLILELYKSGKIKKLKKKRCYSVPANFFLMGITPQIVAEVLGNRETGD